MLNTSKKNTAHEYISINQELHAVIFRLGNYFVLMSMAFFSWAFDFDFPDVCYYIVVSAVVGYDIQKLVDRFIKR